MKKDAPVGGGQGQGQPRRGEGGRDLCYCVKCKTTVPHDRGTPCIEQKCLKCGLNLVPYTNQETKKEYKGQELCICNVCGAKYKRIPGIKCEELFCRRCSSRLSPYIGTTQK